MGCSPCKEVDQLHDPPKQIDVKKISTLMSGVNREASPTTSFCETNPKSPTDTEDKKKDGYLLNSNRLAYSALTQTTSLNSAENTPIKQHFMQDEGQEAVDDGKPKVEMV